MIRAAAAALLLAAPMAAAAQPASITGRWLTADGRGLVEIKACGAALCGRIIQVLNPRPNQPTTDIHNPDPAKRTRPIQGMEILSGFTASGDWWSGRIYDPKSGKTYSSWLQLNGATLTVKGCIGPFCQTQIWKRTG